MTGTKFCMEFSGRLLKTRRNFLAKWKITKFSRWALQWVIKLFSMHVLSQQIYFGVCVTICVTASWVVATHCIKYLYLRQPTTSTGYSHNNNTKHHHVVSCDSLHKNMKQKLKVYACHELKLSLYWHFLYNLIYEVWGWHKTQGTRGICVYQPARFISISHEFNLIKYSIENLQ
jgi:hypothetical protein